MICLTILLREILANFSRVRSLRCASRSILVLGLNLCAVAFSVFGEFLAIRLSALLFLLLATVFDFLTSFGAVAIFSLFAFTDFLFLTTTFLVAGLCLGMCSDVFTIRIHFLGFGVT